MILPAISVTRPWSWAITESTKDVENRTQNIVGKYRGPILIHASATPPNSSHIQDCARRNRSSGSEELLPPTMFMPKGCIVGVACVVGVIAKEHIVGDFTDLSALKLAMRSSWYDGQALGIVLTKRMKLPPVEQAGQLGMWKCNIGLFPTAFHTELKRWADTHGIDIKKFA